MAEKEEKNKKDLDKIKQILDNLYHIDMLDYILEDDIFITLQDELIDKYLADIDPKDYSSFSDDDEVVEAIKPYIVEWFGENFAFAFKDGEYYFLSFDTMIRELKYWFVSKMKVDNLETAKNVGKLFELLEDM